MKYLVVLSMFFSIFTTTDSEVGNPIAFSGKSYVVMDANTQEVLEGKEEHYVQSVASISKIMTCIIAIENAELDMMITVDETVNKAWGSGVYIHIGDEISLKDLLYGLMLRSGNDAALMIAAGVSGSVEDFVELMNQKAQDLGLSNTTFSNPTGLDEEDAGNQSSAYDMAKIMAYCYQNPIFNEIMDTVTYKRDDGNGTWTNKNRLLKEYEYCVGGKTGFTTKARRTLVTVASKDGVDLIIVTFRSGNDFEFHESKYEQYFSLYESTKVLEKGIIEYGNERYVLGLDIHLNSMDQDHVEVEVEDKQVHIKLNDKVIISQPIEPVSFFSCFKMVLKDVFYG